VFKPGSEHDSKHFIKLLKSVKFKHSRGRPRSRPKEVIGDSAYDTKEIRVYLKRRGERC